MLNELVKLYPSYRERWIAENNNIYVSWRLDDDFLDFIVKDMKDIVRIKRCLKIKSILDKMEKGV